MQQSSPARPRRVSIAGGIIQAAFLLCLADAFVVISPRLVPDFSLPVAAAVFVAAVASSIAGFAFSAIAAAMLMHIVDDHKQAIHIMLVASIAQQSYTMLFIWRCVRVVPLLQALAGGLLFLPLGLYLLLNMPGATYKAALGAFLVAYCGFSMLLPRSIVLPYNSAGRFIAGCFGGITGPATAFPGAIPTLWVSLTGISKDLQRGFYQPFILIMQVAAIAALALASPVHTQTSQGLGYVIPALCGAQIGLSIFRRLSTTQFALAVRALLFVSGIGLMVDVLR